MCLAVAGAGALAGRTTARLLAGGAGLGPARAARRGHGRAGRRPAVRAVPGDRFGAAVAGVAGVRELGRPRPARGPARGLGASYALALGAVAVVITATDAFTLLLAWESLTPAFYLLAGFERARPGGPARR